jgi:3-deoxy-D-arabino-heptulosonate 7-phosphate (DAHP) synthase class II
MSRDVLSLTESVLSPMEPTVVDSPLSVIERWRSLPAAQQPAWPDPVSVRDIMAELATWPPLVAARECDLLKHRLAAVARGEASCCRAGTARSGSTA